METLITNYCDFELQNQFYGIIIQMTISRGGKMGMYGESGNRSKRGHGPG